MEIPEIGIREVNIPEVYIPEIYNPNPVLPITTNLEIDVAGCTYQHRDIKNTGNTQLLLDDPNGVFSTCDSVFPNFNPIDYTPDQLIITEDLPVSSEQPAMPETKTPEVEQPKEKEEIKLEPCPKKNAQRGVGDFRNEKKLERVIGFERGNDGIECITLYEKVNFQDQYIPEFSTVVSTTLIASVAATTPLILNAIKPLVKNIIKKLTKKKDKST